MKLSELDILVREGEGTMLEYKEALSSSFAREVVALANTVGGKILLGVRDDGSIAGIADDNNLRARIQDIVRNCDPPVTVLLERVGEVTVVTVRESEAKPVQCSEGFFWRQGAVTQKLSRDEIRDFFRREGAVRFDLALCPRFRYPEDFDRAKFEDWRRRSSISAVGSEEDILVNIDAAERAGGRLVFRNAAVLFFAREPRRFFNQAYVTCLLFKGAERVHVLDRKDFAGGVVSDIEESLRFLERNTRLAYRIERLQREEISEYPMAALREAITNAIMHRDWFQEGANVFVEISEDRIEISNPGGLVPGLSAGELGRRSVRRNPLIADLLHRIAFIEKAGTGIRRMREEAEHHGSPPPEFTADGFFSTVFRPVAGKVRSSSAGEVAGEATGEATGEVIRLLATLAPGPLLRSEAQTALGLRSQANFRQRYLEPALVLGLVEMTNPEKPRSSKQRYRLSLLGRKVLEAKAGS